jgi:peptidyl-prolyl cis-trans isomerase SDCCAG10
MYVLEPNTKGKVILHTTEGPLDVELWSKECPKASRNFVQLCMEGYYDNTIFHRIVKDFLIQGGDPTGTGTGGESIYGAPFNDEYLSRLRFSHRGLVACASFEDKKHQNGSQFFITLDATPALNNKHTIFGKITGDSMYNLLPLNEYEVDSEDRPLEPPKILRTEVLFNPFDDIVPRERKKEEEKVVVQREKGKKNFKLLSFGGEAEEDEEEFITTKRKMVSSENVGIDNDSGNQGDDEDEEERRALMNNKRQRDSDKKEKGSAMSDADLAWSNAARKKAKKDGVDEEDRAKQVRQETKKLMKELKGSKQKEKEEDKEKQRHDEAKELLRNQKEKYRKKQISNNSSKDVDNMFENFRTSLKDPNRKSGIKTHELTFLDDDAPVVDLHTVDEYAVFDPRDGKGLLEADKRMSIHNQKLRAQRKEELW